MIPFHTFLDTRLQQPLPGASAQRRMAPRFANGEYRSFITPEGARRSAVMAILCEQDGSLSTLLTLRSRHLPSHKGQFSFPGGRMEPGESIEQAALRETHEEVGIAAEHLRILGHLSELYTPPSNSAILPVVAWCEHMPALTHSQHEVEETRIVPLHELQHDLAIEEEWEMNGLRMSVPFWRLDHPTPLWGATAIIISELMTLYQEWLGLSNVSGDA